MTQNQILIIFLIELLFFYFIVYKLIKLNKWVNYKQTVIEELSFEIPDFVKNVRHHLEKFNYEIADRFTIKPFTAKELGFIFGNFASDIVKLRFSPFGKNKIILIATMGYKLWTHRKRLLATVIRK